MWGQRPVVENNRTELQPIEHCENYARIPIPERLHTWTCLHTLLSAHTYARKSFLSLHTSCMRESVCMCVRVRGSSSIDVYNTSVKIASADSALRSLRNLPLAAAQRH